MAVLPAGFAAVTPIHAAARDRPACTVTGTAKDDRLRGTAQADVICARTVTTRCERWAAKTLSSQAVARTK